jgi:hypothetical protein
MYSFTISPHIKPYSNATVSSSTARHWAALSGICESLWGLRLSQRSLEWPVLWRVAPRGLVHLHQTARRHIQDDSIYSLFRISPFSNSNISLNILFRACADGAKRRGHATARSSCLASRGDTYRQPASWDLPAPSCLWPPGTGRRSRSRSPRDLQHSTTLSPVRAPNQHHMNRSANCVTIARHRQNSTYHCLGIASGYRLDGRGFGVRVQVEARLLSSPRHPGLSGDHPASYAVVYQGWSWPLTSM